MKIDFVPKQSVTMYTAFFAVTLGLFLVVSWCLYFKSFMLYVPISIDVMEEMILFLLSSMTIISIGLCLSVAHGVVQSKQVEEERHHRDQVAAREYLLDVFVRHVPVAVAMLDANLQYVAYSHSWMDYLGIAGQNLYSKPYQTAHVLVENPNPEWMKNCQSALLGESVTVEKDSYALLDGGTVYVRYHMRRWLTSAGDIGGVIIVDEIITDKVLAEEELCRSNRELEQFAYIASHDLKAPLRGIANLARWIDEDLGDEIPPETRDKLLTMQNRIGRLNGLLNDILKYSRVGRLTGRTESINIKDLVCSIAGAGMWGDGFEITMSDDMPVIMTSRTPLEQVFTNLINNAVKHHDKKNGVISIHSKDRGIYHEFSVSDDGPGVPEEFHERIFNMFQTLQSRDAVEGSGLGLSIVKKLVEWQGGRIWVSSNEVGRGAVFHFLWPKTCRESQVKNAA